MRLFYSLSSQLGCQCCQRCQCRQRCQVGGPCSLSAAAVGVVINYSINAAEIERLEDRQLLALRSH